MPLTGAGIDVLPWLRPSRDQPAGVYDCATCQAHVPVGERARMHCGWMDDAEWTTGSDGVPRVGDPVYDGDVCPAWLVRQAAIHDAAEACMALEAGELRTLDPRGSAVVWEAASRLKRAVDRHTMILAERSDRG